MSIIPSLLQLIVKSKIQFAILEKFIRLMITADRQHVSEPNGVFEKISPSKTVVVPSATAMQLQFSNKMKSL